MEAQRPLACASSPHFFDHFGKSPPVAPSVVAAGAYPAIYSIQVLMKLFVVLAVLGSCSAFAPAAGVRPAVARRSALTVRQVAPVMELETVDTWCAAPAQWP